MMILEFVEHMVNEHSAAGVMLECPLVSDVAGAVVETQGVCVCCIVGGVFEIVALLKSSLRRVTYISRR